MERGGVSYIIGVEDATDKIIDIVKTKTYAASMRGRLLDQKSSHSYMRLIHKSTNRDRQLNES